MQQTRHTQPAPQIGATVAILDPRLAPQVGTFLGLDRLGRATVRPALGGTWAGNLDQIIG